jgi:hypothetical protein
MCMVDTASSTVCLAKSMVSRANRTVPFVKAMVRDTMSTRTPLICTVMDARCLGWRRIRTRHHPNSARHTSGHIECDAKSTVLAPIGSVSPCGRTVRDARCRWCLTKRMYGQASALEPVTARLSRPRHEDVSPRYPLATAGWPCGLGKPSICAALYP